MMRLATILLLSSLAAHAQAPPSSIRLQGYLTDRTVVPAVAADGIFAIDFGLWDQATGGTLLKQESLPAVTVVDGLYDVSLPFAPSHFDGPRWLEIVVDGELLTPRLTIESSPYAYLAGRVAPDGVDTAAIQDQAVSLDKLALACSPGEVIVRTDTGWGCLPLTGCLPGQTQSCYSGPQGTAGMGECQAGVETCQNDGTWGPCDGEVLPTTESCNGLDDDCNGTVDDVAGSPTWFTDADGDGFGAPGTGVQSCNQPPGTVSNASDCFDANANARPGQSNYFPVHRGDGSYDYDCNGNQQQQFTQLYDCDSGCSSFTAGWVNFVPNCGQTQPFGQGCDPGFPPQCDPDSEPPTTQGCR